MRHAFALLLLVAGTVVAEEKMEPAKTGPAKPWSIRDDRTVAVKPVGPTFTLPARWLRWHQKFGNALHLTREELEAVEKGSGDWDKLFGEVVNACLPFAGCAFHGGSEGWGTGGGAYSDLQMRLYVMDPEVSVLEKRIDDAGARSVRDILSPARVKARNASGEWNIGKKKKRNDEPKEKWVPPPLDEYRPARSDEGKWRRSRFRFPVSYGDYGAEATVDILLRRFGERTVAAVFMYTNFKSHTKTITSILDSIAWPRPKKK